MQEKPIYNVFGEPMVLKKGTLYCCYVAEKGLFAEKKSECNRKKQKNFSFLDSWLSFVRDNSAINPFIKVSKQE